MAYQLDYSDLLPRQKYLKALEDIKSFMGEDRFNAITEIMRKAGETPFSEFQLACMFVGVQGFPVSAWYDYAYPNHKLEKSFQPHLEIIKNENHSS